MALTPRNIWTPDGGDTVDLLADMSATAVSVDNAIDAAVTEAAQSPVRTFTTVALLNGWTAPDGTFAYVTNDNTYYVRTAGAWIASLNDTGWVNCTRLPGIGQQSSLEPQVRRKNGVVYFQWGHSSAGINPSTETPVFTIPPGFRPVVTKYFRIAGNSEANGGTAILNTSGEVRIRTGPTVGNYYIYDACHYLLD